MATNKIIPLQVIYRLIDETTSKDKRWMIKRKDVEEIRDAVEDEARATVRTAVGFLLKERETQHRHYQGGKISSPIPHHLFLSSRGYAGERKKSKRENDKQSPLFTFTIRTHNHPDREKKVRGYRGRVHSPLIHIRVTSQRAS